MAAQWSCKAVTIDRCRRLRDARSASVSFMLPCFSLIISLEGAEMVEAARSKTCNRHAFQLYLFTSHVSQHDRGGQ